MFTFLPFSMPWLDWTAYSFPGSKALKESRYNGPVFLPIQVYHRYFEVCVRVCLCVYMYTLMAIASAWYPFWLEGWTLQWYWSYLCIYLCTSLTHLYTYLGPLKLTFLKSSNILCVVVYKMKVMYFLIFFSFLSIPNVNYVQWVCQSLLCKARLLQVPILWKIRGPVNYMVQFLK